jgi:hypothetical protein
LKFHDHPPSAPLPEQARRPPKGVVQAFGRGLKKEVKEMPRSIFRKGEHELAVRDFVADRGGDPFAGLPDAKSRGQKNHFS